MKTLLIALIILVTGFNASAQPMKLAYFESFPPYSWVEENKMTGILIDIVDEVIRDRLNIPVQHAGFPWARAQNLVKSGDSDAFITLPTPSRREYTVCSELGVISIEMKIFVKKGNPLIPELMQIQHLEDLKKYDIVDYLGNGWIEHNLKEEDGWAISLLVSSEQTYEVLNKGRAAIRMDVNHVGRHILKKLNLNKSIIELPKPVVDPYFLNLCIRKSSEYVNIIPQFENEFRNTQKDGMIEKIYDKYR